MKLLVIPFQLRVRYMSINLCGGNVSMAEHLLNGSDVRTILDHVRGKRMSKRVR